LICDWTTLQPIIAVELDDKSHNRKDRRERDKFVDDVFTVAGLPILHIRVRREYDIKKIARVLSPYLNYQIKLQPTAMNTELENKIMETQECPRCGAEMILRTAKQGQNVGQQFWGCTTFPKCRAIVQVGTNTI
ncbi:MAG: DUF2726 domain-containing protein, partial [Bacteroidota bacterium]